MADTLETPVDYCLAQARRDDPDRYLASLFAPAPCRPALWALISFNAEIARTREVVSDTNLGLIRLQWWRDAIGRIYDRQVLEDNPVLVALKDAIVAHDLDQDDFDTLIYAREFDLEDVVPANLQGLENYADYTTTPLFALMAKVTGYEIERERLRYLAVAYALTGLLRAVPFHARARRCYLPEDILAENGIVPAALYEGQNIAALPKVVANVVDLAREHLMRATEIKDSKMLRALHRLAGLYLRQIEKAGYNVFAPRLQRPPAFRELRVYLATIV